MYYYGRQLKLDFHCKHYIYGRAFGIKSNFDLFKKIVMTQLTINGKLQHHCLKNYFLLALFHVTKLSRLSLRSPIFLIREEYGTTMVAPTHYSLLAHVTMLMIEYSLWTHTVTLLLIGWPMRGVLEMMQGWSLNLTGVRMPCVKLCYMMWAETTITTVITRSILDIHFTHMGYSISYSMAFGLITND